MFKNFFKFVGENKSCRSIKDFINAVSGKSYLNGMYRFFEKMILMSGMILLVTVFLNIKILFQF